MPQEVVRTPVGYKAIETGSAPARAIFPVYDTAVDPFPTPNLAYKVEAQTQVVQTFIIRGVNLDGIVGVDVSEDVNVAGNGSPAPIIQSIVFGPTSITVDLDTSQGNDGSMWGVLLTDADGNQYAAPSPIKEWVGE